MSEFTHLAKTKNKVDTSEVVNFSSGSGYPKFVKSLTVERFRHLENVSLNFRHPISVISGTNKVGKTSILLLLACSHENFLKLDASKPEPTMRQHIWKDVIAFTSYESEHNDYSYRMDWRDGTKQRSGRGKRLASSKAWSGLAKKGKDRINAKIKKREVRFSDLERLLPARSFSTSLLRKANSPDESELSPYIAEAFCYVFSLPFDDTFKIKQLSGHVNKRCYLIESSHSPYSSYNAATGEESVISILRDSIESESNALILIDEVEAGLHPNIQRRLIDALYTVSWRDKKQFILSSHSPTVLSSVPSKSRIFIEKHSGICKVLEGISPNAAQSKMDAIGYPLVTLYCEDEMHKFLISHVLQKIQIDHQSFDRNFEIIISGGSELAKTDFERHRHRFSQSINKLGYCSVLDGDVSNMNGYSHMISDELVHILPFSKSPEEILVDKYLEVTPNSDLLSARSHENAHSLFVRMQELGLAYSKEDARSKCFSAFEDTDDYEQFFGNLKTFLVDTVEHFGA